LNEGFSAIPLSKFPQPLSLPEFSQALLDGIKRYRGGTELEDDITLLTLRRSA
jgi:serine phosphatase RsbU (regulator of sigma subunit)